MNKQVELFYRCKVCGKISSTPIYGLVCEPETNTMAPLENFQTDFLEKQCDLDLPCECSFLEKETEYHMLSTKHEYIGFGYKKDFYEEHQV